MPPARVNGPVRRVVVLLFTMRTWALPGPDHAATSRPACPSGSTTVGSAAPDTSPLLLPQRTVTAPAAFAEPTVSYGDPTTTSA
ncbi:hypothetical protein SBADM41S_06548 [Streptomyces badius]